MVQAAPLVGLRRPASLLQALDGALRHVGPNLLIPKHSIRYLFKEEELRRARRRGAGAAPAADGGNGGNGGNGGSGGSGGDAGSSETGATE